MMNRRAAVVYASKYGTTKRYAEWIAEALHADLMEAKAVKPDDLQAYDIVIFGGGLYAGGIDGIQRVTQAPCKNLVVFTVGLADPKLTDYAAIIEKNLTPELARNTRIFHLRGGIDYRRLGPVHKAMMAMMRGMIRKKPEAEQNDEDREFLRTYNQTLDFSDCGSIEPIVSYVKGL